MPVVCVNRPNRKYKRHFTERCIGRIIATSRAEGVVDDSVLIAHILAAFGRKELGCLLFRIFDILNVTFFLGALVTLVRGLATLVKGLKILVSGGKSKLASSILELIVPAQYWEELGLFLTWIGGLSALLAIVEIWLLSIVNSAAVYLLAQGVCDTYVAPYPKEPPQLQLGGIIGAVEKTAELLEESKGEIENGSNQFTR